MKQFIEELMAVTFLEVDKLKPSEEFSEDNLQYWLANIKEDNIWTVPILVDRYHYVILDGHHRYNIAKRLGLKYVPVVLTTHANPLIELCAWRENEVVTPQMVIDMGNSDKVFPYKTTRHIIKLKLPLLAIPLDWLSSSSVK